MAFGQLDLWSLSHKDRVRAQHDSSFDPIRSKWQVPIRLSDEVHTDVRERAICPGCFLCLSNIRRNVDKTLVQARDTGVFGTKQRYTAGL